ncbi:UDP-N-acetylglucosamine 1-carboxyvinyltransferase [Mechercharimyces sp. CAU 1602]|uniref:UDP-N-acetylglucosamine 1-carboxyvinyltransferase n=1 Tax=Mechercharimyces sp. CAU 1602 TaxID=2973933 RepID=UPI002161FDD3|nr:UDP-N-acetylglucosamine 1-carboxyvinyltransferase [Mechercharimyces sp. CAU 1602]MCS1350626.1 UDP-N-acetylglucosamine 1-carboxyvinyltransferase [Mechercharimyces sp. CAU 1602]
MTHFNIEGGYPLVGTIRIQGAKNAALPILAATVLAEGVYEIRDVPRLSDIEVMIDILEALGARITRIGHTIWVNTFHLNTSHIPHDLMRKMRSSIFLMGPLLSRLQEVCISRPGGCAIGARPIDLHLKGLQLLGSEIDERDGHILCRATMLQGAELTLEMPSVGATENLMMAAVKAEGTTVIRGAAREPEIVDLQSFLNNMGADIEGAGTNTIVVRGVKTLSPTSHTIIPDRIVAGTLMAAAAATQGEITLQHAIAAHLDSFIQHLKETGTKIEYDEHTIWLRGLPQMSAVRRVATAPYPGFPTDLQPQMMVLLSLAQGSSLITESIFDARLKHVDELKKMGAHMIAEQNSVRIRGVPQLYGAHVYATDLRAGAALVIAGLCAEGRTKVEGISHIDRGYERLEEVFCQLGGKVDRSVAKIPLH